MTSVRVPGCVFFYGHTSGEFANFSQFAKANFSDGSVSYTCAEQYMMASKARIMGDTKTYAQIMESGYNPQRIKALGRKIKPFDQSLWNEKKIAVVTYGNFLKFTQNQDMQTLLLDTGEDTLAEAAQRDTIWGIGRCVQTAVRDYQTYGKTKWVGTNLLGEALMTVREAIRSNMPVRPWEENDSLEE